MAYDFALQETSGSGINTILSQAASDTCNVVTGICAYNTTASVQVVRFYHRYGGVDYEIYSYSLAAAATCKITDTLVIPDDSSIRANSGSRVIDYSVRYSIQPYGDSVEIYDPVETSEYRSTIGSYSGTSWTTLVDEPDSGYRNLIRTVTLANAWISAPTTSLGIKKISTATVYNLEDYALGVVGSGSECTSWTLDGDGAIILEPDYELGFINSIDPTAFVAGAYYQCVGIES